jgi:hypothetical protein
MTALRVLPVLLFLAPWLGVGMSLAQDSRLDGRVDPAVAAEVEHEVESARAAGLPTEPLLDKALEGAAKGAEGSRIVVAVRTLASGLASAREALGPESPAPDLLAGAEALRAGVAQTALSELRHTRPDQPLLTPLAVISDLIARGVPADTAAKVVVELASRGASDEDLGELQRGVERDIQAGAPPLAAVTVRSGEHEPGASAGSGSGAPRANPAASGGGNRGQDHPSQGPGGKGKPPTAKPATGKPGKDKPVKGKPPKGKPPKDKPPKSQGSSHSHLPRP